MTTELDDIKEDISRYEEKLASVKREIAQERVELSVMEGHVTKTNEKLSIVAGEVSALESEKSSLANQIALLNTTKNDAYNELNMLKSELEVFKTGLTSEKERIERENKGAIESSNVALATAKDELKTVQDGITTGRAEIASISRRKDEIQGEVDTLSTELEQNKALLGKLADSIEALKVEKAEFATQCDIEKGNIVSALNVLKEENAEWKKKNDEATEELARVQKEAFNVGEITKRLDKRERELADRENKVVELYTKAGVAIPA